MAQRGIPDGAVRTFGASAGVGYFGGDSGHRFGGGDAVLKRGHRGRRVPWVSFTPTASAVVDYRTGGWWQMDYNARVVERATGGFGHGHRDHVLRVLSKAVR